MENILIVAQQSLGNTGGIQTGIMNSTKRLKDRYHFDIVVFDSKQNPNNSVFSKYGDIYIIPCVSGNNKIKTIFENLTRSARIYRGVKKILENKKYAAVHVHDELKGAPALKAAMKSGVPIRIVHTHNPGRTEVSRFKKRFYYDRSVKKINKYSNCKVGCSADANNYMFPDKNDKTYVINNELELSRFQRKSDVNYDGHRFVHVGRFTDQKNHIFLLDVFAGVKKEFPDATLRLQGWGELKDRVEEKIKKLSLEDCVELVDGGNDVPTLFENGDYMIFPSLYEGFGRVLIEAQAMEIKCFASDVCPKTTDAGLCSYLPLDDGPEKWSRFIIDYLKSGKRCEEKADRDYLKQFDADEVIKMYDLMYQGKMMSE